MNKEKSDVENENIEEIPVEEKKVEVDTKDENNDIKSGDKALKEAQDKQLRLMAEFENFRKRSDKEKTEMFDNGVSSVIEKILPIVDNFERGLASSEKESQEAFYKGFEGIYKQFIGTLNNIGVEAIETEGKEFNPDLHNAVMHEENEEYGNNVIVEELQKGYTYKGKVIRYSMVKVAN